MEDFDRTIWAIQGARKTEQDIVYVGSHGTDARTCSWDNFKQMFKSQNREDAELYNGIIIMFADGSYLEREWDHEWDSWYWVHRTPPSPLHLSKELTQIFEYLEDE